MTLIPLVLDFESYYDKDYSLKKMPTAQYVRDERFKALGAGVRLGNGPATWLEPEPLREFLDAVPANKISAFGGDYCFVDGVAGHLEIARRNVARALAEKVKIDIFERSYYVFGIDDCTVRPPQSLPESNSNSTHIINKLPTLCELTCPTSRDGMLP